MIQFLVVIPIYNSQNTLRYTLDSLKNQTYTNYKAILIDDGSTDSSYQIAQEYTQDDRIILHKQKNSGVSIARNKALKIAKELYERSSNKENIYITFLDSDDLLENFALEHYKNIIEENKDIQCILNDSVYYMDFDYTNKKEVKNYFLKLNINNMASTIDIMLNLKDDLHSPYMFCYNATFLFNTKINFIEKNIIHEDNLYHTNIMLETKEMYINYKPIYTIVLSRNSLTRSSLTDQKHKLEAISYLTLIEEYDKLLNNTNNKKLKKFIKRKCWYFGNKLFNHLLHIGYFDNINKKSILRYSKYLSIKRIILFFILDIFPNIIKNKSKL